MPSKEEERLRDPQVAARWKRWGPYLSERQWGTVREDYSPNGDAWDYLPHEHARSRVYRWGEDGLAGLCDSHQHVCFALALWNEKDHILKERLFGLANREGNHGEDVKEYYFYLDALPSGAYLKYLYKYPQAAFPYAQLVAENARRTRLEPEYELIHTGIFRESRYFDVFVEYAKADPEDILVRIAAWNRGPDPARLHLLPVLWFRNRWGWGDAVEKPSAACAASEPGHATIVFEDSLLGRWRLITEGEPAILFTENETNFERLYATPNSAPYTKDAFHRYVVEGERGAVNPAMKGTKCAAHYQREIPAGASWTVRLRLTAVPHGNRPPLPKSTAVPGASTQDALGTSAQRLAQVRIQAPADNAKFPDAEHFGSSFDALFDRRKAEADEFFAQRANPQLSADSRLVQRQAFAGLLWGKQCYHYEVLRWLEGDPGQPTPDAARWNGRNHEWVHLYNSDVISMPDKWEYPWYAAWDLGFHCVAMATVDPDFAKEQLVLFLREWYMHPNGQLPAYEWNFSDVNPPVQAWAAWRVYRIEQRVRGAADRPFLERIFQKLLLNFTWWVNRKDPDGRNVFQGGFLGLDNIGVFDRSRPLGPGRYITQSDSTSWMAMYCLDMLAMALELAREDPVYEDVASKFFEHFVYIARAMNNMAGRGIGLWDEQDGFYYDVLHCGEQEILPMRIRSMVGLIPLFATETFEPEDYAHLKGFRERMDWFLRHHPDFAEHVDMSRRTDGGCRLLLTIANRKKLERIYRYLLDESEFLSPCGVRALSKYHAEHPFVLQWDGEQHSVDYEPAESTSDLFGGNSNWRGPVWFPMNFLLIESLQRIHYYYGDEFQVECPAGSGRRVSLWCAAAEISRRLARIFLRRDGRRPVHGNAEIFQNDPYWRDLILFYEYFHGENGAGLGASHQTGWTALVAKLIEQSGE